MTHETEGRDRLWLYRIDDDRALDKLDEHRDRITKAVRKRGGDYLWLRVPLAAGSAGLVILSTVDHSCRPYKGSLARRCDQLTTDDALAYLHRVLWHGVYKRRGSKAWSDDRAPRAQQQALVDIGRTMDVDLAEILEVARATYDGWLSSGRAQTAWPDDAEVPPALATADAVALFTVARQAVLAAKATGSEHPLAHDVPDGGAG